MIRSASSQEDESVFLDDGSFYRLLNEHISQVHLFQMNLSVP